MLRMYMSRATYHVFICFKSDFEDIALLSLCQKKEHALKMKNINNTLRLYQIVFFLIIHLILKQSLCLCSMLKTYLSFVCSTADKYHSSFRVIKVIL